MKNVGDILTAFMLKYVNIFIFPTIHKCIEYCGEVKVKGLNYFGNKLIHILQSWIFRSRGVMVKALIMLRSLQGLGFRRFFLGFGS